MLLSKPKDTDLTIMRSILFILMLSSYESIMILLLLVFWYCLLYSGGCTHFSLLYSTSPFTFYSTYSTIKSELTKHHWKVFWFCWRLGILFLSSCSTVQQSLYSLQSRGWGWTSGPSGPVSSWLLALQLNIIITTLPSHLSVFLEASWASVREN